jgi:PfaB family protein
MNAIREAWGISPDAPLSWRPYNVRATPAQTYAAIRGESRAYLCMINSPEQCVIAGEDEACGRALARLGSAVLPMPIAVTMHCPPALSEQLELTRIHDLDTSTAPATALYFLAGYQAEAAERGGLARAIAGGYTKTVDFPRLVNNVYSGGARIFVELGGRRNCRTWIEKILLGRPHAAIPCDAEGLSSDAAILRAIARLFAHRVPVKLDALL